MTFLISSVSFIAGVFIGFGLAALLAAASANWDRPQ